MDSQTFTDEVMKAARKRAKYVFMDVVGFSKKSAEAQSYVVRQLNSVVEEVLPRFVTAEQDRILLPTGDGMCVALMGNDLEFDSHVQFATAVLQRVHERNEAMSFDELRFEVRIGVNENTDILVTDINGNNNLAGAGINVAARIMDKADGGQVLVSQFVYHELKPSMIYRDAFSEWEMEDKHGESYLVYQLIADSVGLNTEIPSEFAVELTPLPQITVEVAYYLAFALKHEADVITIGQLGGSASYALTTTLGCLAADTVRQKSPTARFEPPSYITHQFGKASFVEQVNFYRSQDFWLVVAAANGIIDGTYNRAQLGLKRFPYLFEKAGRDFLIVSETGKAKLETDWHWICADLGLPEQLTS